MLCSFQIRQDQPAGLLGEYWLHPIALPYTPYAAACGNCTHRREHSWRFRAYVTTCTIAGARVSCIALTDPTYTGGLPMAAVWGAVANGRGTMVDTAGGRSREARFSIRGSTGVLSNANPPTSGNMLGYSSAVMLIHLLQAPIGLTTQTQLNITIMAQCRMTPINPIPGFLHAQAPTFQPMPNSTPDTPDWMFAFPYNNEYADDKPGEATGWILNHTGDAWLAGGFYIEFKGAFKALPSGNAADGSGPHVLGVPEVGSVYITNTPFPDWTTNQDFFAKPIYFAIFCSPISQTVSLVGFTNYDHAMAQASGNTGMVPSNAELCVTYHHGPIWSQILPYKVRWDTSDPDGGGPLQQNATYRVAAFWKVGSSAPPLGRPVYANSYPVPTSTPTSYPKSIMTPTVHTVTARSGYRATPYDDPLEGTSVTYSTFQPPSLPQPASQQSALTPILDPDSSRLWGYTTTPSQTTWNQHSKPNTKSTKMTSSTIDTNWKPWTELPSTTTPTPESLTHPSTLFQPRYPHSPNTSQTTWDTSLTSTSTIRQTNLPPSSTNLITSSTETTQPLYQTELDDYQSTSETGSEDEGDETWEDSQTAPTVPSAPHNPFQLTPEPARMSTTMLEEQALQLTQRLSLLQLELENRDGSLRPLQRFHSAPSLDDGPQPIWTRLRNALRRHQ